MPAWLHIDFPEGIDKVQYDLTLEEKVISPDGYKMNGTVVNGQYPGPLIEANWGDTIRVRVHNKLKNHNGTAIHWHGIRMLETVWQDGVPGVTQCPSAPGETQVFEFRAMQYGTSWYHGHFSLQYTNGILGRCLGPYRKDFYLLFRTYGNPWTQQCQL